MKHNPNNDEPWVQIIVDALLYTLTLAAFAFIFWALFIARLPVLEIVSAWLGVK